MTKKSLACIALGSLLFSGVDATSKMTLPTEMVETPSVTQNLQTKMTDEEVRISSPALQDLTGIMNGTQTAIDENVGTIIIRAEAMGAPQSQEALNAENNDPTLQNAVGIQPTNERAFKEKAHDFFHRAKVSLTLTHSRITNATAKFVLEILMYAAEFFEALTAPAN